MEYSYEHELFYEHEHYEREHDFVIKLKRLDFRFYYFWLCFAYQNFQNGFYVLD